MDYAKITELTNQLGITSRTLRYYEQIGLIQSVRPQYEKYRFYDNENIERVKQILVLRKMQIPIKDIIRIYESKDLAVLVESFVNRINAIDDEIESLGELKFFINKFMQAMKEHGIKHISALPLLYDTIDKQLEAQENQKKNGELTFKTLSDLSQRLSTPPDLTIINLPPMRVISSYLKGSGSSDVDGLWDWLEQRIIPFGTPGSHKLFEYQDANGQTVIIHEIDRDFPNDSQYSAYEFEGGLFAVGSVYVDDDIALFHKELLRCLDDNQYYQVDYRQSGLRHQTLVESVISPDKMREKIDVFLPVKERLPNSEQYDSSEQVQNISVAEIEQANPVLSEHNLSLPSITPINSPHYKVLETGEAEYICWISARKLSTNVQVKIPFRVDIEFKVESESERFGYGSDEGSIRFYHGGNMYGINMDNHPDSRLSKQSICFNEPIIGKYHSYAKLGRIDYDEYNNLTWIVGEKHFAVIVNGEVRYCGVNFPYMSSDLHLQKPETIIIGSNGQGKKFLRSVKVSQLKTTPKINIKTGGLTVTPNQSNNVVPNIHQLITMHHGENYWFNGCARYVMECLGEEKYDYSFFAGLTGDNFAQVYSYDRFRGDGVTDYILSERNNTDFIEKIFAACGYESTFVTVKQLAGNKEMYLQTLKAYIDKGIPVIFNFWGKNPKDKWGWGVFVGYENYGKTLLYMTSDAAEPDQIALDDVYPEGLLSGHEAGNGWIFVGQKKQEMDLADIYRNRILTLPQLLTTKTEGYCFGAEAFRSWAADIENGRFDNTIPEEFDTWAMYTVYVCNLATNSSCCHDFLNKALKLNPDMKFLKEISDLYKHMAAMWNNQNGEDLEALGGGFNITLETLQDKQRRTKIAAKIREFAEYTDKVTAVLSKGLKKPDKSQTF